MKDIVIIGAGPAGLSAALYSYRAGMDFVLMENNFVAGGQVLTTYEVDNYLGLPSMNGFDMGMKFKEHIEHLGIEIQNKLVSKVSKKENGFVVTCGEEEIESKTVLIATGAVSRLLGVEGEERLKGKGVAYCATCDGAFYRGKTVAVVGGSYTAVEDAIFLAGLCEKVYLIHRRDTLRAGAVLEKQLFACENVEILWDTIPLEILGEEKVSSLKLEQVKNKEIFNLEVAGVFVAVGTTPSSDLVKELVEIDSYGYIKAPETGETSQAGVFVAGDVRTKHLRQIVTAVADGANAATAIWSYLTK